MEKIVKFLSHRVFWVILLLIAQVVLIAVGVSVLARFFYIFYAFCIVIAVTSVIWICYKNDNPSYKLLWVIPIMLAPVVGGSLYLIFGNKRVPKRIREHSALITADMEISREPNHEQYAALLSEENDAASKQATYLVKHAGSRVFTQTKTNFQSPGEVNFARMLEALESAQHYIFMEYFIVHHGQMLDTILDILERKAAEGVDVRFLYDDFGSIYCTPPNFIEEVSARGIKIASFNRFQARLTSFFNNRDHRKICVIDGVIGFTGGVNLADEYINVVERFGHWKDSALELRGDAVWALVCTFLENWNLEHGIFAEDFEYYRPSVVYLDQFKEPDGYVVPFSDSPIDNESVGESVYRNMISMAGKEVFIETPYFIVGNELISTIELAAKSGVDVRLLVPHIPDKKLVFLITQSFYPQLLRAGVRVYEYTPGFIHTKACIADGEIGVTGTVNFDYRSLYLHYECGVWMYGSKAVSEMRADFMRTLEIAQEITELDLKRETVPRKVLQAILRLIAPLM